MDKDVKFTYISDDILKETIIFYCTYHKFYDIMTNLNLFA